MRWELAFAHLRNSVVGEDLPQGEPGGAWNWPHLRELRGKAPVHLKPLNDFGFHLEWDRKAVEGFI